MYFVSLVPPGRIADEKVGIQVSPLAMLAAGLQYVDFGVNGRSNSLTTLVPGFVQLTVISSMVRLLVYVLVRLSVRMFVFRPPDVGRRVAPEADSLHGRLLVRVYFVVIDAMQPRVFSISQ